MTIDSRTEHAEEIERWHITFEKLFGKVADFSDIVIPAKPEGLGPMRLVIVPTEIAAWTILRPLQGTMDALKKHFPTWQYAVDLEDMFPGYHLNLNGDSYAFWVQDIQEAREATAVEGGVVLAHKDINLLERMLLEADYFFEHGKHLDMENVTLCAASRDHEGMIPNADWFGEKFCVTWSSPSSCDETLSSRSTYF